MSTATTFDALEVPPLAHATGYLVIPVLFQFVSGSYWRINTNILPLVLIVLDCRICVG
jgi:hypothetical protein